MFDFLFRRGKAAKETLPYQRDIHSHLIPGVDDGSRSPEFSLEMAGKMHEWGIREIIATPHRTDETFENTPETIRKPFLSLKEELSARIPELTLTHSFEYRLDEGFLRLLDEGGLIPLRNNYLLVENSFIQPLRNLPQVLFNLKMKGFRPILAHPERYMYYTNRREMYQELHDQEIDFQLNLLSFSGCYGREVQQAALWLLDKGYVDFLATDLHHAGHIKAIDSFLESKNYRKLKSRFNLKNDLI